MKSARLVLSLGLAAMLLGAIAASDKSSAAMAGTADRLLAALTPDQLAIASLTSSLNDEDRPEGRPRSKAPGVGLEPTT